MKRMILITLVLLNVLNCPAPGLEQDIKKRTEQWLYSSRMNSDKLILAIAINDIAAQDMVYCQSRLETGNYQSVLCIMYNNLFGMRLARIRPTTATGETENGYAVYNSWYDSVRDMKMFQEWYEKKGYRLCPPKGGLNPGENESYLLFLRAVGYAEDPGYINKLNLLCSL